MKGASRDTGSLFLMEGNNDMVEKKISRTEKIQLKGLTLQDGEIVDADGCIRDLNKVITTAFREGDIFDFAVNSKSEDVELIEEDGEE